MKVIFFLLLLSIVGCGEAFQTLTSDFAPSNSINSTTDSISNGDKLGECPTNPGTLRETDVKTVAIANRVIKQSGQLRAGQNIGYKFEGKEGQKLTYQTSDDICLWFFTPNNEILSETELPQDGIYVAQISIPQGSRTFDLEIGLDAITASEKSNEVENQKSVESVAAEQESVSTTSARIPDTAINQSVSNFTQEEAVSLVNRWLKAKQEIFSPPFNRSLAAEITTGTRYHDILKTNGSIDWLQKNNSYYKFNDSYVSNVWAFSNASPRPRLKVSVYEDLTLYTPKGINRSKSGASTRNYTFYFAEDNETWKIYDAKIGR